MNSSLFFGVSLTASFLGGMLALFAPCCITFLFPSYLGTIFKEKGRILFLTLVFAAGLGSVLIPVAMGMRIIVSVFDRYHTATYLLGAAFMAAVGLMTLFNVKLALPVPRYTMPEKTTIFSTYILGIFSGITSSCCAPVLFAAVTLSSLSPTLLTAFIVSAMYVAGIVFPLFLMSLFYERLTNQYLYKVRSKVEQPLKYISAVVFFFSAVIIAFLAVTGRITMDSSMAYGSWLRMYIFRVSSWASGPVTDALLILALIVFIYFLVKEVRHESEKNPR